MPFGEGLEGLAQLKWGRYFFYLMDPASPPKAGEEDRIEISERKVPSSTAATPVPAPPTHPPSFKTQTKAKAPLSYSLSIHTHTITGIPSKPCS